MGLLRHNPGFRTLWIARSISFLGDSIAVVALLLHVQSTTGTAVAVALLLFVGDCVPGLLAPLTGAVADRAPLKTLLVSCELVSGALVLALATLPPLPVMIALAGALGVVSGIIGPAARRAVPLYVADAGLEGANAAIGVGTNGVEAIGPVVAGALLLVTDVPSLLVIDAVTFGVAAATLATLPGVPAPAQVSEPLLTGARAGLRHLWATPLLRPVALGFVLVVACTGVDDVALVFLAKDELSAGDSATALLYAGVGIGLAVGYLLLVWLGGRVSPLTLFAAGLAISSAGNLLTGLAGVVAAALALQAVRGVGIAAIDVGLNTHVQREVPPSLQGRVFGNLYGGAGLAAGLSYLVGGWLLQQTDARTVFVLAGAGGLVATIGTVLALHRNRRHRPE